MSGKMNDVPVDETPWEVSVLVALLRLRWLNLKGGPGRPESVVHPLDGPAETALGDILLKEDDRLFLFELKASWERANSEIKKPIFERYTKLRAAANSKDELRGFHDFLSRSLRCHQLVYWEDSTHLAKGLVRGTISFSPYALFVLDKMSLISPKMINFGLLQALGVQANGEVKIVEAASILNIFDMSAKAVSGDLKRGMNVEYLDLGLDQGEFLLFVKELRGSKDVSDISVKMIAFSPISGFLKLISSVEEAVQLGVDWVARKASTKPAEVGGARRTGKPRVVDDYTLRTSAPNPNSGASAPTSKI